MIDFVRVGETIARLRRARGMSQDELAGILYVTRQALSKWERGAAAPSIDSLAALSELFGVSFEELLCINEKLPYIDERDIFRGREREYIMSKILSGELELKLADVFYQMSPAERMHILREIKCGRLKTDREELYPKLTPSEQKFLGRESAYIGSGS